MSRNSPSLALRLATIAAATACSLPMNILGQVAAPAEKNLLRNGDFEAKARPQTNLYDGVDQDGFLKVKVISVPVLGAGGGLTQRRIPPTVALQDMNRDGKVDIVTALPEGYIYVYFNQGEPAAPRFTHAEILPVFLSRSTKGSGEDESTVMYDRRVPRICLAEWTKPGVVDIVSGNLFGQLFLVPGGMNSPERVSYTNPRKLDSAEITTHSVRYRYWGNLFSPQVVDWDGDGRRDIVMGEGSYSANSVFLMHNKSTSLPPQFKSQDRHFLVSGEGREQLIPTLADINGDGRLDLLVADNAGVISAHLQPEDWKLGDLLPLTSILTVGGKDRQAGAITIHAGDYNGDGLFDLLMGDNEGTLKVAVNTGNKQEPSFPKLEPIPGTDVWTDNTSDIPSWYMDQPNEEGNALGYHRVVSIAEDPAAQPSGGTQCLLVSNFTPLNSIVQPPPHPTMAGGKIEFWLQQGVQIEHNAKYTLTAMVRGQKVRDLLVRLEASVKKRTGSLKVELDERGAVPAGYQARVDEGWSEGTRITPGTEWNKVTHSFTARLKSKELKDVPQWNATLNMYFELPSTESRLYVDDVQLTVVK